MLTSAVRAWQGPSMAKGQYPTAFPLKHQQKDLRLALELAAEHRQTLPLTSAANDLYVEVSHPCPAPHF